MQAPKPTLLKTLAVYAQWQMLLIFFLGISSGFTLLLTGSTLAARLTEDGIDIQTIGVFALVGLPYTLKFLWAPFVDAIHFPGVKTRLWQRKSWLILSQIALVICLLGLSRTDPSTQILQLAGFALATAFFSSLQDIVIDALRIEMLPKDAQGAAAASSVAGYRIGMLMAGAGAFVLATYLPWNEVYLLAAGVMLLGLVASLCVRQLHGLDEALSQGQELAPATVKDDVPAYLHWFREHIIAPIADFLTRPEAIAILLFIALYKLGDAMAGSLSVPFYLQMGFTKVEIAAVTKVFGVVAVLAGTFMGGLLVKRTTIWRALLICGILQIASNFAFIALYVVGASIPLLTVVIAVENISGGMGTAAFVAFMSSLCHIRFTATQYALLTSLSSVGRTLIASSAGVITAATGWGWFFAISAIFGLPGMLMLIKLKKGLQEI